MTKNISATDAVSKGLTLDQFLGLTDEPEVKGTRIHVKGSHMANYRDEHCEGPADVQELYSNIGPIETDSWSDEGALKFFDYARKLLIKPDKEVCDRGSGTGYGWGGEAVKEKGFTLDMSFWGLLSTDTLDFCYFIMDVAHANEYLMPQMITGMLNNQAEKVEKGEEMLEAWAPEKLEDFFSRSKACVDGFKMYVDEKTGASYLKYPTYNGKRRGLEEICMSAMYMVVPKKVAEEKPPEEEAGSLYSIRVDEEKCQEHPNPVWEVRDIVRKALVNNPPELMANLVKRCGPEIEGYGWLRDVRSFGRAAWRFTKKAFYYVLGAGGIAGALALLYRITVFKMVMDFIGKYTGLSKLLSKLWKILKGPPKGPKGPRPPAEETPESRWVKWQTAEREAERSPESPDVKFSALPQPEFKLNPLQYLNWGVPTYAPSWEAALGRPVYRLAWWEVALDNTARNVREVFDPVKVATVAIVASIGMAIYKFGPQVLNHVKGLVPAMAKITGKIHPAVWLLPVGEIIDNIECNVVGSDSEKCKKIKERKGQKQVSRGVPEA